MCEKNVKLISLECKLMTALIIRERILYVIFIKEFIIIFILKINNRTNKY